MAVLTRAGDNFSAQMVTTIAPNGAMKCRPPEALDDCYLAQSHRPKVSGPSPDRDLIGTVTGQRPGPFGRRRSVSRATRRSKTVQDGPTTALGGNPQDEHPA